MSDQDLAVSRLPGVADTAREVLGLDPWKCDAKGIALFPTWWPFDLDDELSAARQATGRDDPAAHLQEAE